MNDSKWTNDFTRKFFEMKWNYDTLSDAGKRYYDILEEQYDTIHENDTMNNFSKSDPSGCSRWSR